MSYNDELAFKVVALSQFQLEYCVVVTVPHTPIRRPSHAAVTAAGLNATLPPSLQAAAGAISCRTPTVQSLLPQSRTVKKLLRARSHSALLQHMMQSIKQYADEEVVNCGYDAIGIEFGNDDGMYRHVHDSGLSGSSGARRAGKTIKAGKSAKRQSSAPTSTLTIGVGKQSGESAEKGGLSVVCDDGGLVASPSLPVQEQQPLELECGVHATNTTTYDLQQYGHNMFAIEAALDDALCGLPEHHTPVSVSVHRHALPSMHGIFPG